MHLLYYFSVLFYTGVLLSCLNYESSQIGLQIGLQLDNTNKLN